MNKMRIQKANTTRARLSRRDTNLIPDAAYYRARDYVDELRQQARWNECEK